MQLFIVSLITTGLVVVSFAIHYIALRWCANVVKRGVVFVKNRPMLFVLAIVFIAHLAEVMLFAFAFYLMHWNTDLGSIAGSGAIDSENFVDYFYFSITTYTTLGVGDLIPTGAVRIVTGVEALVGLVLIAWTASFSYLMMENLWTAEREAP
ncbi:potassium channel family protein [Erythrobacter alti]|uniref:potassium channel family protein n=1 Tax=Erythrobacter alti TaxID=1896145 RepID=UPI0030F40E8B